MLRTCVLGCAMAGVLGLTVGCKNGSETKPPATQSEAVTAYQTKLTDADKKIAALKEKMEKATGEEKTKLETKLKEATSKREALAKKVDEVKAAAADKFESVKKDADTAFEDFKKFVD